jgi:diacylglycerol kinase family enzyme
MSRFRTRTSVTTGYVCSVTLTQLLLKLDGGEATSLPEVEYRRVRAFTIEPTSDGFFSLDGEFASYTALKCQVLPSIIQLLY